MLETAVPLLQIPGGPELVIILLLFVLIVLPIVLLIAFPAVLLGAIAYLLGKE